MEYPSHYTTNIPQTFELIKDTVAHPENLLENATKAIELSYGIEPTGLNQFIHNCSGLELEYICRHFDSTKNWKYLVEMLKYYDKFLDSQWIEDIDFIRALVESGKEPYTPYKTKQFLEWFKDFETPLDQFIPFIRLLISKGKMQIVDSFIRDLVKASAQSYDNHRIMALIEMAISAGYDYNYTRNEDAGVAKKFKLNLLKFAVRQGAFDVCDYLLGITMTELEESLSEITQQKLDRYQKIKNQLVWRASLKQ